MADPTTPAPQTDEGILILAYIAGVAGLIILLFCVCFWIRRIRWRPGRKYLKEQKERQVAMQAALTGQPLRYKNGHPKVITVKEQERVKKKEAKKNMVKVTVHDIKMERLQRRRGINTSPVNGHSQNGKTTSPSLERNGRHSVSNGDVVDEPYGSMPAIKRSQAFYGSVSSLELPSLAPIHEGMHSPSLHERNKLQLEDHEEEDVTNHVVECDVHVSARRHDNNVVPDIVVHKEQEGENNADTKDEHPESLRAKTPEMVSETKERKAKSPRRSASGDVSRGTGSELIDKSNSEGNLQTNPDVNNISNAQVMENSKHEPKEEVRSKTPRKVKSPRLKTEVTENDDVAIVTPRKKKARSPRNVSNDSIDGNATPVNENPETKKVRKKKSPRPKQITETENNSEINSATVNNEEAQESVKPRKKKTSTPTSNIKEGGEDNPSFVEEV